MTGSVRDREFLGQGLAFPLQFSPRGGVALAAGERDIEQSIRIILETSPGERVMRPEFGCRIKELIFAPRNAATQSLLVYYVQQALAQWEPRIEVRDIIVTDDPVQDGQWLVEIQYEIKSTHDPRAIIYPFYIEPEQ